ncbi:MAG: T9SS type A sorting domain-containing protein, partial [Bacteroidales bacterium]
TTFNTNWLGCPDYGPKNEPLQMQNIALTIQKLDADIVGLQEVTNNPTKSLSVVLGHLGNAWDGYIVPANSGKCAQSQAIIYKKNTVRLDNTPYLLRNGGTYNAWSSGRYPVESNINLLMGDKQIPLNIINIHAKAYSDEESYNRRVAAFDGLKKLLDGTSHNTLNSIILGDYNDYTIGSQCGSCGISPFKNFIDDVNNYKVVTQNLNTRLIDHIMISNELFGNYVETSAIRETEIANTIPNFRNTTSDHYPISASFRFYLNAQHLPLAAHYETTLSKKTFTLPKSADGRPTIHYRLDSGIVAQVNNNVVNISDTGKIRVLAWGNAEKEYTAEACFFDIYVRQHETIPKIEVQPQNLNLQLKQNAKLSLQASGTNLYYQWFKNGHEMYNENSPILSINNANYENSGIYMCKIWNSLGSVISSNVSISINGITSAIKQEISNSIKIYPNPFTETINIHSEQYSIKKVYIYSMKGTLMLHHNNTNYNNAQVNCSHLSKGIYAVQVILNNGKRVTKLVIKK